MAEIGEAGAGYQPHITRANHHNSHESRRRWLTRLKSLRGRLLAGRALIDETPESAFRRCWHTLCMNKGERNPYVRRWREGAPRKNIMTRNGTATVGHLADPTANRLDWVDYAKGICIIMVVMMHATLGVEAAAGHQGFMHAVVEF